METKKILHMGDDDSLCWEYEGKKYLAHVQLDEMANDPRNRDTLTIMACFHNMYILGDDLEDKTPEEFWQWLVRENVPEKEIYEAVAAGKLTGLRLDAVADHLYDDLTVQHCMILMEPYAEWLPLWLYDHSGITMSCGARTGQYADPWDSGYVGWIIAMKDTIMREFGTLTDKTWRKRAIETMESDVDIYNKYITNDVYGYTLYAPESVEDEDGFDLAEKDSCWGFYGSNIFESGMANYLPGFEEAFDAGTYKAVHTEKSVH